MADTQPLLAKLEAGDALYLPDGWWHVIRSHGPRNVAVALEIEPYYTPSRLTQGHGTLAIAAVDLCTLLTIHRVHCVFGAQVHGRDERVAA